MAGKRQKKPISKLSVTETKNLIKSAKRKATIQKNKLFEIESSKKKITDTEKRKNFENIIQQNKKVEILEESLRKKQLTNKIKSQKQKIDRNKGKDEFKVRKANFEIEILKEKIQNPQFEMPVIQELPEGDFFTYTSAFYYYNDTKKKLLEMVKSKQIKSLNGLKSLKSISKLISEIFIQLDSEKAVEINIEVNTDKAFITVTSMEEAKEGETFIEPKEKKEDEKNQSS
jgi:hypothetical protein